MDKVQRTELLRGLHRGEISRNREFERFRDSDARRVLLAYRRLRSLIKDLARPGVRAQVSPTPNPGGLAVAIDDPRLRYRRVMILALWEVEFLQEQKGAPALLDRVKSSGAR